MSDPVYEDFLDAVLKELVGGPLNREALTGFMGQDPRVIHAFDDLCQRGLAADVDGYLSLTEKGRARIRVN